MKEREEKNSGRRKKVRKKSRTTEFSITIVLCCLVAVLTVKGISLQQKVNANASRLSSLDSQIEEEKQRTDDITALKEYMQTDEYIEKINTSIEFLQEKKRNGEHLDAEKEAYISSAIRLKVQKGMDKKPLRTRIEEIQKIINAKETLSVQVTKCVYPNVRINLNSFTTTTSAEYGKCNIVCGPNDIEFR